MHLFDILDIQQEKVEIEALIKTALQDPCQYRFLRRSRKITEFIFEKNESWDEKRAQVLLNLIDQEGMFAYPLSLQDGFYQNHVIKVLTLIQKSEEARLFLRRLTLPLASPFVEKMVRVSLLMTPKEKLKDKHARMALLSALLTPLRQSVGSCFATAPLIVLQNEAPERVLEDLYDLMTTGRLKKVVEGQEWKVPMSLKTGYGDLRKMVNGAGLLNQLPSVKWAFSSIGASFQEESSWFPCTIEEFFSRFSKEAEIPFKSVTEHPFLKIWEYTIASFSDFKTEFYKWNLFASLGFNHEEPGGLGEMLYQMFNRGLEEQNGKIKVLEEDLIIAEEQIRVTEILLRNAYSEEKIRRLKGELQIRERQFFVSKDLYEEAIEDAKQGSQFFRFFIDQFMLLFPQYFQELYDPEMYEVPADIYEDMPAGFRLVYKHGRYDPTVWTIIENKEQYIKSLADFVYMIESQLISACDWKKGKGLIPSVCTEIVNFFYDPIFLEKASERIAKLHEKHMVGVKSVIQKETPWAYSSGGSLTSLLKCYFGLKNEIFAEQIQAKNLSELAVFLTDLVKDLPTKKVRNLLLSSSTHAFSLCPDLFRSAWEDPGNTHTWLRDHIFQPQEKFYRSILLKEKEQFFLSKKLGCNFFSSEELYLTEFAKEIGLNRLFMDSFYRSAFPLIEYEQIELFSREIRNNHPVSISKEEEKKWLDNKIKDDLLLFKEAHILLEELLTYLLGNVKTFPIVHEFLPKPPEVFLFADTNWPTYYFGILFSAASGCFDLWRLDALGLEGSPMTSWRELGTWTIYTSSFF